MKLKEFFSFKQNRVFWLNIIGMAVFVVAVMWGTLKGIDIYTRHGESISVPDVKGMTAENAIRTLAQSKLVAVVVDSTYATGVPYGAVVDQSPLQGARVKDGRQVYLTICTNNMPTRAIPDVIDNSSLREAQARLQAAGFKLTDNEYTSGDKDWVYGLRYQGRQLAPGDRIPVGATVTLIVGGDGTGDMMPDSLGVDSAIEMEGEEMENPAPRTKKDQKKDQPKAQDESWF